jgi:hypothetical protein
MSSLSSSTGSYENVSGLVKGTSVKVTDDWSLEAAVPLSNY